MTPALVDVLDGYLRRQYAWRWAGNVLDAAGQSMECAGPLCSIGDCCEIVDATGRRYAGQVIGFRGQRVLAMPLEMKLPRDLPFRAPHLVEEMMLRETAPRAARDG